ncbi:rab-GTPase-TBC domain-containing protein [Microdochium trichocladiopsis]|uniref:Rab-GTPase-TBC domain-containing protein n=1 Tax=Microdochium trichocladiopsis TaxID=1682393 RepID=A0A9P9BNV9_9PEZI|nr:rab-GTPase-TBC domain-containing protein [Microdochium trichocladiopsis]KAH7027864.1 rab-GTPase-TBC domain-containing protein [Microdochium trichocladiopsis]
MAPADSQSVRSSSSRRRRTNHERPRTRGSGTEAAHVDTPAQLDSIPAAVPRPNPPNIRLISAEAEKESQKVRSLYTSGEGLNWEDVGEPPPPLGGAPSQFTSDSPLELPPTRGTHVSSSVTLTDGDDPNLPAPWTDQRTEGIEDWDGINVEDVDRYGFILPAKPQTRTANSEDSDNAPDSPRKSRSTLRKMAYGGNSLTPRRGPSRKSSARSLHSHASDFSTATYRSSRSPMRTAMNLLPHNRDRRLVDEAGDVLAMQPGLTNIAEDESAEILADEAKRKEVSRTEKWRRMATVVKQGEDGQGMVFEFDLKHPKLLKRVWKGIPDCWRSAAWFSFLASSARASGDSYATDEQLKSDFLRLVDEPSPDDGQIDLDVPRTINQHIMFRRRYRGGQRLLFRVLHCVSLYFPNTGYVQGMAPLAATLLSYYDEENCFIMLVRLWEYRGLDWLYTAGFEKLMETLQDFETLWLTDREVTKTLSDLSVQPMAYATRWYLTLFNLAIPFAAQLRIWDAFMLLGTSPKSKAGPDPSEGETTDSGEPPSKGLEILHAASAAIIDVYNDSLVDSDFENAMKILTSWVPIKDVEHFIGVVHAEWKRHENKQKSF